MAFIRCNNVSNNELIKSVTSPNQKYIAVIFKRDLGATTKTSYQLSILKKGKSINDSTGNIFVTYEEFDVKWNGDTELIVEQSVKGEIFKQETNYKNIIIKYE